MNVGTVSTRKKLCRCFPKPICVRCEHFATLLVLLCKTYTKINAFTLCRMQHLTNNMFRSKTLNNAKTLLYLLGKSVNKIQLLLQTQKPKLSLNKICQCVTRCVNI